MGSRLSSEGKRVSHPPPEISDRTSRYARSPTFPGVAIGLVVIQKDGLFCATHERDGWYLPAGRVDAGETFSTGASREAREEAGIDVKLTGLVRLQFTPNSSHVRMRAIYTAVPESNDAELRGLADADDEIVEAKWVTISELQEKPLRSPEVISTFSYVHEHPSDAVPTSVLVGADGPRVNHEKVRVNYAVSVDVCLVVSSDETQFLLMREDESSKWIIPHRVLPKPMSLHVAAKDMFSKETGVSLELSGIIRLHHYGPDLDEGYPAILNAVFAATVKDTSQLSEIVDSRSDSRNLYAWFTARDVALDEVSVDATARLLISHFDSAESVEEACYPLNVVSYEFEELTQLYPG